MNLGTAVETMQLASKLEAKFKINTLLQRITQTLSDQASDPEEPSFQAQRTDRARQFRSQHKQNLCTTVSCRRHALKRARRERTFSKRFIQ